MQFDSAASNYTFTGNLIPGGATLSIGGAGIISSSGSPAFNFVGLQFSNTSGAGNAIIQTGPDVQFNDRSSAQNAVIANQTISNVIFRNSSTAGNATITNTQAFTHPLSPTAPGTKFFDTSSAGNARIINTGDSSNNGGFTFFRDSSTAGNATISNDHGGETVFYGSSSAGNATITVGPVGGVRFLETSTAANANINLNFASSFGGASTAGNSTITTNDLLVFFGSSTAGSATITTNQGILAFMDRSTGGQARLIANSGARVDFSFGTGPNNDGRVTAGSIEGVGTYFLGANQLAVGNNNLSTTVSGVISDGGGLGGTGGSLAKVGTGTLTLAGASTYTGPTAINAGTLLVDGSITSNATVGSGATLGGSGIITGNITNSGILAPRNATSIGTLRISGNLSHNPGSTLLVNTAPTQASMILVTGIANLAGSVTVNAGSGTYNSGTKYTILTANGGVNGTFSGVATNFAFLTPSLSYDANDAFLTFVSGGTVNGGYTAVAQTGNQLAVGNALNNIASSGSASNGMQTVLTSLNNLTAEHARNAYDSIGGASLRATSNAQLGFMGGFNNVITGRLGSNGQNGGIASPGFSLGAVQLAAQDLLSDANPIYAQAGGTQSSGAFASSRDSPHGVWTRVYGNNNDTSSDGNASGYHVRGSGFTFGVDRELNHKLRVGVAIGVGRQNLSVDTGGDSGTVDATAISVYGQYATGLWTFKGIASYARDSNHSARNVVVGSTASVAIADYKSNSQSAYAEASYRIPRGAFEVQPIAALSYVRLDNPAFIESGAGALNLAVASQTRESIRTYLGAKAVHTVDVANGTLRVEPRLLWSHEFGNVDTAPISAQITGGGAAGGFQVLGVQVNRNGAVIGLGLSGQLQKNLTLLGDVSAELRSGQQSTALFVGLRYVW